MFLCIVILWLYIGSNRLESGPIGGKIYQLGMVSAVVSKIHIEESLVKISIVKIPDRVAPNES